MTIMSETEIRSGVQLPMVNSAAARRLSDTSWPFERGINLSLVLLGFSAASYAVEGRIAAMVVALCACALVLVAMRIATSAISIWLTALLLVHVVLGMTLHCYDSWPHFDDALHFGAVGWLTYIALGS
jgi:hypothetical protein